MEDATLADEAVFLLNTRVRTCLDDRLGFLATEYGCYPFPIGRMTPFSCR
jgi:hypothetical protein